MANLVPKAPPRGVTLDDWTPKPLGVATLGVSEYAARADHTHPGVAGDGTPITRELIVGAIGFEPIAFAPPHIESFALDGDELVLTLSDGTEFRVAAGAVAPATPGGRLLLNGGGFLLLNGGGALLLNGA